MLSALRKLLLPKPKEVVEENPLVTYTDPTAWMSEEERSYHTHGGVGR